MFISFLNESKLLNMKMYDYVFLRVLEWITLCSCLNVKGLLARNSSDFWSFSDCNGIRTHNHLVHKRTLNHLAKMGVRLQKTTRQQTDDNNNNCFRTIMNSFICMILSCVQIFHKSSSDGKVSQNATRYIFILCSNLPGIITE